MIELLLSNLGKGDSQFSFLFIYFFKGEVFKLIRSIDKDKKFKKNGIKSIY